MGLRTPEEYIESLKDGRTIYYRGKKVDDVTKHEVLSAAVRHASDIFRLQFDPKYRKMLVYNDPEYGEISSFYKIPRSFTDLVDRFNLIYETTRLGRGMFNIIKAIGSDALFALMIITKRMDKELGTDYYKRVMKYYEYVVKNDLALAVAQTDVKGDRSLRPHQQRDPDLYLRIVKKDENGIVVRGAKVHTTQSIAANEIIVLPTRAMTENDRDYAVAFAVPANAKGLKLISRPMKAVESALKDPSFIMGRNNVENETLTVFDDVFVPWDRVFMAGEWPFAGALAVMFPTFHRFTAISYRAAMADLLIGVAKILAEYNGVDGKPHIRRDIVEIIKYKELLRATAIASSYFNIKDELTGIAIPNVIITNVGKLLANEGYLEVMKRVIDIAGGLAATAPTLQDFENPEIKGYLEKYLVGREGVSARERVTMFNFLRELLSSFGALFSVAMMHAEGSIEASVIELYRSYDYKGSRNLALYAAGLKEKLE
jgi:4-hydroxybutyryl-CoA dehydratase/vinylacetyl-CoA-Delta-isomerase